MAARWPFTSYRYSPVDSLVLRMLDEALTAWRVQHPGQLPAAVRLGERHWAQLVLDIAAFPQPWPQLETNNGRPVRYHAVELFPDEILVDGLAVL